MSTKGTLEQQAQTLSGFTVVTTAFLPLSFCTSYFGMNNIKEFNASPISRRDFWMVTGPVCGGIILLTVVIIFWERLVGRRFRAYASQKLSPKWKIDGIESQIRGSRHSKDAPPTSAQEGDGPDRVPSYYSTTH
ncbi:unnamed protein product, partial [Tuber aestivum]